MADSWYLLADIGGTNARFALGVGAGRELREPLTVSVADHPTFTSALQAYLQHVEKSGQWQALPSDCCLAVACPVNSEVVTFTNSDWVIHRDEVARSLELPELKIINDFTAIGYAAMDFVEEDWIQVGDGQAQADSPMVVLGPGTGLGVCSVIPGSGGISVVSGEGGHVDFSPVDDEEIEILRLLLTRYGRVSAERLLSGAGLQNIYWALGQLQGTDSRQASPADISVAALTDGDALSAQTLAVFCRVLGGVAGNLALTLGAHGGVYIAGGIVPRVLEYVRASDFRERFVAKGRFREYLNDIPTRLVTRDNPGLYGALGFLQRGFHP